MIPRIMKSNALGLVTTMPEDSAAAKEGARDKRVRVSRETARRLARLSWTTRG